LIEWNDVRIIVPVEDLPTWKYIRRHKFTSSIDGVSGEVLEEFHSETLLIKGTFFFHGTSFSFTAHFLSLHISLSSCRPFLLTSPFFPTRVFSSFFNSSSNCKHKRKTKNHPSHTPDIPTNKMRMPLILGLIAVCTAAPTGSPLRELESYSVEELDELLAEYSLNTDDMASIATNPGALLFPSVPTTPLDRTETYVPTRQLPIDQKPFSASPTLTTPRRKVLSKRPMTIQEGLRRSMREIVIRRTSKSIWNDYAASGCSSDKGVLQWLTNRIPDWTTQLDFFRTECIEKESPGAVTAVDIPHYIHMAVLSWIHTQIPDLKASDEDNVLSQQVDLVEMISNRALDNANQDTYFIDVLTLMSSKKGHNFNAKASKLIREIEANEDAVLLQKRSIEAELAKKAAEEMAREEVTLKHDIIYACVY